MSVASDPLAGVSPFADFGAAAQGAVEFLQQRVGLDLWLVTQVKHDRQVAVAAHPPQLVQPGMGVPWAEGFCSRMVSGEGPRVASVTAAVPAYAGRSFGPAKRVAAYLGVPLLRGDGGLFGTVCGFGLRAQPATLSRHLPLVEHVARMLSTVLAQEGAAVARQQQMDRAVAESERDVLTGLLNRRGWQRALALEQARSSRMSICSTVVVLDVDGLKTINDAAGHAAGDEHLRRVAAMLTTNSRPSDVIARTGGDEFAVLLSGPSCDEVAQQAADLAFLQRLEGALTAAGCPASVGWSHRRNDESFEAAWLRADAEMYEVKRLHRSG